MNTVNIATDLEKALGALADLGFSRDMTLKIARSKARRVYTEIRRKYPIDAGESPGHKSESQT